jgi:hypothetical protein
VTLFLVVGCGILEYGKGSGYRSPKAPAMAPLFNVLYAFLKPNQSGGDAMYVLASGVKKYPQAIQCLGI